MNTMPDEGVRKSFQQLNPASTTSSLERIENNQGHAETQPAEIDQSPKKSEKPTSEDIKIEQEDA